MNGKLHSCLNKLDEMIKSDGRTLEKQIRLRESLIRVRAEKEIEDQNNPIDSFPQKPITRRIFLSESISNGSSV